MVQVIKNAMAEAAGVNHGSKADSMEGRTSEIATMAGHPEAVDTIRTEAGFDARSV
jgi:hypothetical protein